MMKIDAFDFVIVDIFSQLVEIDDQWRSIIFYFRKMIFAERNYEINDQKMFIIVKICKKWRHYIENVKYLIRMIIDHANFKNFFINKVFNRKEVKWWKKLIELDLRITSAKPKTTDKIECDYCDYWYHFRALDVHLIIADLNLVTVSDDRRV
jgi:hypothetical protein